MGSSYIRNARNSLSPKEQLEWNKLERKTSKMWRIFWVKILHKRGMSNIAIAKEFGISESTVRNDLKAK